MERAQEGGVDGSDVRDVVEELGRMGYREDVVGIEDGEGFGVDLFAGVEDRGVEVVVLVWRVEVDFLEGGGWGLVFVGDVVSDGEGERESSAAGGLLVVAD